MASALLYNVETGRLAEQHDEELEFSKESSPF